MRKSKFTESQILTALKQAESGLLVNEASGVCGQVHYGRFCGGEK